MQSFILYLSSCFAIRLAYLEIWHSPIIMIIIIIMVNHLNFTKLLNNHYSLKNTFKYRREEKRNPTCTRDDVLLLMVTSDLSKKDNEERKKSTYMSQNKVKRLLYQWLILFYSKQELLLIIVWEVKSPWFMISKSNSVCTRHLLNITRKESYLYSWSYFWLTCAVCINKYVEAKQSNACRRKCVQYVGWVRGRGGGEEPRGRESRQEERKQEGERRGEGRVRESRRVHSPCSGD